jgi:hypothetical protein
MAKITTVFCLVAVCLLAGSPALAKCADGNTAVGSFCVPNDNPDVTLVQDKPSSPSDETKRFKPVKKLGVHPSTPSGEQVCPKGYWGTPPNCTRPYQKCPPYGC